MIAEELQLQWLEEAKFRPVLIVFWLLPVRLHSS